MRRSQLLISVLIVILSSFELNAQNQHTNQARGFSANGVYSSHDIDHVNLFNGNLTIPIPIGQKYTVGGQLSYQLTLVYNSYLWSQREVCTSVVNYDTSYHTTYYLSTDGVSVRGGGLEIPTIVNALDPYDPGHSRDTNDGCYTIQYPNPAANAGMGWQLTFGRLYNPVQEVPSAANLPMTTEKHTHVFQSADGSEHTFYPTLHEDETKVPNVFYTRDGSYLRMTTHGGVYEIQFPNGVVYTFGSAPNGQSGGTELRVTNMRDQFNNFVNISYSATQWVITDSANRRHTVNLAPQDTSTAPQGTDAPAIEFQNVVTGVSLESFSETGEKAYANYNFTYYSTTVDRALPRLLEVLNGLKPKIFVPFLTSIKLPDGSKYSMPENAQGSQVASYDYTGEFFLQRPEPDLETLWSEARTHSI